MGKITDELKPCPFCDGKPTLHQPRGSLGAWISCAQCGLEGPTETGVTEAVATAHWNTRTALASAPALTAGEREPVAWRARHSVQENWYLHTSPVGWWECQPLYVSPPASELEVLRKEREYTRSHADNGSRRADDQLARALAAESRLAEALKALEPDNRHEDRPRNVIINVASSDLENIINGHDPDVSILANDVWDRLDKMACDIEARAARRVRDGGQADG